MTHTRRRRQNTILAGILIGGTALINGCASTPPTLQSPRRTTLDTRPVQHADISALSTDSLIESHRKDLERLVDSTKHDDIERGGVILYANGKTQLIEIHNLIRDGPELIERCARGEHDARQKLQTYLTSSALGRKITDPESTAYYSLREHQFTTALNNLPYVPQKQRDAELALIKIIYSELALHCTYMRDEEAYERLRKSGKILFHVHTHHDGEIRPTPPKEDPLRPSGQDLDISKTQEGIITGVDRTGRRLIYYTHQGQYRVIRPENALALR